MLEVIRNVAQLAKLDLCLSRLAARIEIQYLQKVRLLKTSDVRPLISYEMLSDRVWFDTH